MEESLIYEGRIREIEEVLIRYFVEGGKTKRTEIESHLLAYLLLHPKISQTQIHELSIIYYKKGSKRGISRGAISSYLNLMTETFPLLKKEKVITDKNYAYVYSFEGSLMDIFRDSADLGLNIIRQMVDFFKLKLKNLTNLGSEERAKANHYPTLLLRVKDLADFWELYSKLFAKIVPEVKEVASKKDFYRDIENLTPDLKVEDIETELIKVLSETPGFAVEIEDYTKILSYIIIRKRLTQGEIHKLTGFSSGHISQALNFLIENELVTKVKIEGIRKPFYEVESIPLSYLRRFRNRLKLFEKWKPELEAEIKELETNEESLKNLKGYDHMKKILKGYASILPVLERFITIFDAEIKKLE